MTLDELIHYLQDYRAQHPGHAALDVSAESESGLIVELRPTLRLAELVTDYPSLVFADE